MTLRSVLTRSHLTNWFKNAATAFAALTLSCIALHAQSPRRTPFANDFGSNQGHARQGVSAPGSSLFNFQNALAAVPWTNGKGLITGATLQSLFSLDAAAVNDATLGYTPLNKAGDTMLGHMSLLDTASNPPLTTYASHTLQNSTTTAANIYAPQVPTSYFTVDGYRSVLSVPLGATATNTNAFGYYVSNKAASTGAQGNAVGVFGTTTCEIDNCASWGFNPTLIDSTSFAAGSGAGVGRKLIGNEIDFAVTQTGTIVSGVNLQLQSSVAGAGADGFQCGLGVAGPMNWTKCFVSPDGASQTGLYMGSIAASGTPNAASQPIELVYYDGNGVGHGTLLQAVLGSLNVSDNTKANGLGLVPATTGNAPSIIAQGSDANIGLALSPKGLGIVAVNGSANVSGGLGTGNLAVTGYASFSSNTTAVPSAGLSMTITGNQAVSGETDIWNDYSTASTSFRFNQVTGTGTFVTPLTVTPNGIKLRATTVAALPTCSTASQDTIAIVSDATTPTYRGALTGGGSVRTMVECDGATWTSH